ncbi:glycosyltransferase family 87 protein [Asticcacaulis solisilvae]|uniref:glycosyltransferase family 87 protein n=1 Tax=Asticcacaulis solisilvae TaxID=1217274 RepID=UPI003FD7FEE8
MDALTFLQNRTRTPQGRAVFVLLCLMPVVGGIIARLIGHDWAFMDIDAVLCAAKAEAAGHSPYGVLKCSGIAPAPYVYAPQIAGLFQPLVATFGALGARLVFIFAALLPATAVLLWFALWRAMPDVDWRLRWLAFSGLTPMTFCCGNIGIVMHAAVLLSLLTGKDRRWPFVLTVLVCVALKPTFLAYFIVFLFEDRPWRARFAAFAGCVAEGLGVTGLIFATAGPLGPDWHGALHSVALTAQPGLGWLALTSYTGLPADAAGTVGLTLGFMTAMLACGVAVAEWSRLDGNGRRVMALGLAPLMTPRLMDYDMILIVPCAALLISLTPRLKQPVLEKGLPWVFAGVLGLGIACNIVHLKHWHRTHVAMFLFCSLILVMGARLAAMHLKAGKRNEEGMLPNGGKGDVLPLGKAVRALFNPATRRSKDRRAGIL